MGGNSTLIEAAKMKPEIIYLLLHLDTSTDQAEMFDLSPALELTISQPYLLLLLVLLVAVAVVEVPFFPSRSSTSVLSELLRESLSSI